MEQGHIYNEFHKAYYDSNIWSHQYWRGAQCMKSVFDSWNYQEIIFNMKPDLVIEIGTYRGGSSLMLLDFLKNANPRGELIAVDISHELSRPYISNIQDLIMVEGDSLSSAVITKLQQYIDRSSKTFMLLDGEHRKHHVLQEMIHLGGMLKQGDYLIVEDGNINGHPVLPGWGDGPSEAIQEYFTLFPNNFKHDYDRERKFGFTFAPEGYLIKL